MKHLKPYKARFGLTLIVVPVLLIVATLQKCNAQVKNDTLYYKEYKFYPNQVVKLGCGSANKKFAFVYCGSGLAATLCTPYIGNMEVVIKKVAEKNGILWANGKAMNGKMISINVPGAVDNNEVVTHPHPEPQHPKTSR